MKNEKHKCNRRQPIRHYFCTHMKSQTKEKCTHFPFLRNKAFFKAAIEFNPVSKVRRKHELKLLCSEGSPFNTTNIFM